MTIYSVLGTHFDFEDTYPSRVDLTAYMVFDSLSKYGIYRSGLSFKSNDDIGKIQEIVENANLPIVIDRTGGWTYQLSLSLTFNDGLHHIKLPDNEVIVVDAESARSIGDMLVVELDGNYYAIQWDLEKDLIGFKLDPGLHVVRFYQGLVKSKTDISAYRTPKQDDSSVS